jgi:mRNA interferase MazF
MKEGQILIGDLPQSDGTIKRRPVLVLRQLLGYGDYLVCGISSQLWQEIKGFDEVLPADPQNGLRVTSVIRLGFLDTMPERAMAGNIGRVPDALHRALLQRLADYLNDR